MSKYSKTSVFFGGKSALVVKTDISRTANSTTVNSRSDLTVDDCAPGLRYESTHELSINVTENRR